jgi:hypothetical protein
LTSSASGKTVSLTWTDSSTDETGFKVLRKDSLTGSYSTITTTSADDVYKESMTAIIVPASAKSRQQRSEQKPMEVIITGIRRGRLIAREPEKLVPKWGITIIRDRRGGETPYINLKGLLWLAHQEEVGLQAVETEILEEERERVVVRARVRCRRGVFEAHGTWEPAYENDSRGLEKAESRAIARALRFATGAGTSVEELPDEYFAELEKRGSASSQR